MVPLEVEARLELEEGVDGGGNEGGGFSTAKSSETLTTDASGASVES